MFNPAEYDRLKDAVRSNNYDEVIKLIKELEGAGIRAYELEEHDAFGDLPYPLLAMAVGCGDPVILEALIQYGFDPALELGRVHPLHMAAERNKPEHASILLKHGVSVESSSSKTSLSPLYVADRWGSHETVTVLLEHGARVDPDRPLTPNKISPKKFEELLKQHQGPDINVAELLRSHGFALSLSGFHLKDAFIKKFNAIDFSNLDLNDSIITISSAKSVNFQHCNLSDCYVNIKNSPTTLNFSDANTKNAIFVGDNQLTKHLEKSQLEACNILAIDQKDRFDQRKLISVYDDLLSQDRDGVCFGLCVEYMLRSKKHVNKSEFIDKLQRKMNNKSESFSSRISFFQKHSQGCYRVKDSISIDNQDVMDQVVIDRIFSQIEGNYIHLGLNFTRAIDGHAVIVKRINSASGIYYQIFDPNIGESIALDQAGANKYIKALIRYYQKVFSCSGVKVSAENLEERYEATIKDEVRPTK